MPRMALRAVLLCLLLLAGCGGGDDAQRTTTAPPRDPTLVAGGVTALELDGALTGLLDLAGVRIEPVAPARQVGQQLRFPITGGRLDLRRPAGTLEHDGALRVQGGGAHPRGTAAGRRRRA
jgi:hypothetical protein